MKLRALIFAYSLQLTAYSLSGCGYTTRSLLPTHIKTVYVENFKNSIDIASEVSNKNTYRLYEPNVENEVTQAISERFIFDGNLRVVRHADGADSVLSGELLEYVKEPLRYDDNDNVIEYRIRLTVRAKFLDRRDNKVIWEVKSFSGESNQSTQGSLQKTEETARQEAISDLSRRIVEKAIEVW